MEQAKYRILLTSDIHCTDLDDWYGMSNDDRMQKWVDAVLDQHAKRPFDLILIVGDISLDFHCDITPYEKGYSSAQYFVEHYLSQLPKDVPLRLIAGNHEFGYPNEEWKTITGHERQSYAIVGNQLFILLDSFQGELAPDRLRFTQHLLEQFPTHDVWIISHFFELPMADDAFGKLIASTPRIKGLFMGHTHRCGVIPLGEGFGNKTVVQLGNFSFTRGDYQTEFWGLRDLLIYPDRAISRYLQLENDVVIRSNPTHIEAQISHIAEY